MLNFFKKNKSKKIVIDCQTDCVKINDKELIFPTNSEDLALILGKPSRELNDSYLIWDEIGVFCSYRDVNNILSIYFYQNKKDRSKYNTKRQFKGKLMLNKENISNNEFSIISLGKIAIHRLGSEKEVRFGFSIGVNNFFN